MAKREITFLDRPPPGWFTLDVMQATGPRRLDWVALMIDAQPDDFINYRVETVQEAWVRIPGKHRNRDAAYGALEAMVGASPAVSEARQ